MGSFMWGLIFLSVFHYCYSYNISEIQALRKHLFQDSDYDTRTRPTVNQSEQTEVQIKMSLNSISDYSVLTGKLTVLGYLTLKWKDHLLQWTSEDFGGVSRISVLSGEVWTPEIKQIADNDITSMFTSAWLNDDGQVSMAAICELIGYCDVDVLYFPVDKQTCSFSLIAPHFLLSELKFSLIKDTIETTMLLKHGEWQIIGSNGFTIVYNDSDMDVEVRGVQFELNLQRRPMFILMHTTAPLFLIALLNMMIYVVPIQSGERISFSVTVLLALIFFTSNIADNIPQTALNVPIMSMLTAALISLCTVNVIISVIFSRIAAEKFKPVSGCLHSLVRCFLKTKFGNGIKVQQVHPGEVVNLPTEDCMVSENKTAGLKHKYCEPKHCKKELEITWMMVVDVFDCIMFYVHLLVVFAALTLATLFIVDVI